MDCSDTFRWIWEVLEAPMSPSADLQAHLDACVLCSGEFEARRRLDLDLRALRAEEQEEPSEAVNRRVLTALVSQTPAKGPREKSQLGLVPEQPLSPQSSRSSPGFRDALREVSPLLALAAALAASLLVGFNLGQSSFGLESAGHTVKVVKTYPRSHQVGLSQRALEALEEGNTYMLIGPRGGPYQVIDVTSWDRAESVGPTAFGRDELVLAVGPAGGWSRGKTLLLGDLAGPGVEILARRALTP